MTEFHLTADGSLTCLNAETDELYHNRAGAFTEALTNYVQPSAALEKLSACRELHIVDACFGLGYNSFVLMQLALQSRRIGRLKFTAVEIDPEILHAAPRVLQDARFLELRELFANNTPVTSGVHGFSVSGLQIILDLRCGDLRQLVKTVNAPVDLIFHDPFSPRKVPELWSTDLFRCYFQLLSASGGEVLTYSSAGAVRGGLREAGFHIYKTASLGNKPGGTLAKVGALSQLSSGIQCLSDKDLDKLSGLGGIPYRDSGLSQSREVIYAARLQEQALRQALRD